MLNSVRLTFLFLVFIIARKRENAVADHQGKEFILLVDFTYVFSKFNLAFQTFFQWLEKAIIWSVT